MEARSGSNRDGAGTHHRALSVQRRSGGPAAWALPAVVVLIALVMTALNLNGSSVELLGLHGNQDPSLVSGVPRGIRSDEFLLTTPQVVGNARRGLPVEPWIGLTKTFLPATALGVPARHWTSLFKPRDWGFFLLPVDQGFSWWWWWPLLIGLLGVYCLVYLLGRRPLLAAGLAVVLAASPYSAWWSTSPSLIVGTLSAAAACAVAGLLARRWWAAVGFGLLGGCLAVSGALTLYPPWQISVVWLLAAAVGGLALDHRVGWRRLGLVAVPALSVIVPALLTWSVQSRPAMQAIGATIYPGNRISTAGGGSLQQLLATPSTLWTSAGLWVTHTLNVVPSVASDDGAVPMANQSELASTWLPLPLLAVVVIVVLSTALSRRRGTAEVVAIEGGHRRPRLVWTTALVAAAELLVLAWTVLPLPQIVGTVTLLDRVPGYRTQLALGLGAVLLMACGSTMLSGLRLPRWGTALIALAAAASAAALIWGTEGVDWYGGAQVDPAEVAVIAVVMSLGFALLLAPRRLAALGAVVLAAASVTLFVQVNPLTRGLGPLEEDPVIAGLRPYVGHGTNRAAVFGNASLSAMVSSTGLENVTGLTLYPDTQLWQRLDPHQEDLWNNYAKFNWIPAPGLKDILILPDRGTRKTLAINPCASTTRELGIDLWITASRLNSKCLRLDKTIPREGRNIYVYVMLPQAHGTLKAMRPTRS